MPFSLKLAWTILSIFLFPLGTCNTRIRIKASVLKIIWNFYNVSWFFEGQQMKKVRRDVYSCITSRQKKQMESGQCLDYKRGKEHLGNRAILHQRCFYAVKEMPGTEKFNLVINLMSICLLYWWNNLVCSWFSCCINSLRTFSAHSAPEILPSCFLTSLPCFPSSPHLWCSCNACKVRELWRFP